jgi:hypothetical protein
MYELSGYYTLLKYKYGLICINIYFYTNQSILQY